MTIIQIPKLTHGIFSKTPMSKKRNLSTSFFSSRVYTLSHSCLVQFQSKTKKQRLTCVWSQSGGSGQVWSGPWGNKRLKSKTVALRFEEKWVSQSQSHECVWEEFFFKEETEKKIQKCNKKYFTTVMHSHNNNIRHLY